MIHASEYVKSLLKTSKCALFPGAVTGVETYTGAAVEAVVEAQPVTSVETYLLTAVQSHLVATLETLPM